MFRTMKSAAERRQVISIANMLSLLVPSGSMRSLLPKKLLSTSRTPFKERQLNTTDFPLLKITEHETGVGK